MIPRIQECKDVYVIMWLGFKFIVKKVEKEVKRIKYEQNTQPYS